MSQMQFTKKHKRLGLSAVLIAAALSLTAQAPPMPPPIELKPVTVKWERLPWSEYYRAENTNGEPVNIVYRVYNSTNVAGPWAVVAETTNTVATVSNLVAKTQFFFVTSSNVFLESDRSDLLSLPVEKVAPPVLLIP